MAMIAPFRGIRYNPDIIKDVTEVVTPPYDVISPAEQEKYFNRHPYNIIRLDLNPPSPRDTAGDNPHTRAAAAFAEWQRQGVLRRDSQPAIYLSRVDFNRKGRTVSRHGMIVQVKLEPFENKIILPHEKTFSKVKSERLDLMKACHANFSPVFSLYSDQEGIQERLLAAAENSPPVMDIVEDHGLRQRMWVITEPAVHDFVVRSFAAKRLFIADGHHRYETALNYRQWLSDKTPDWRPDHPANYMMMYLCSMEDPGLVVLPAHRLLSDVPADALADFIRAAADWFEIETVPFTPEEFRPARELFLDRLERRRDNATIGVAMAGRRELYLLTLRQGAMDRLSGGDIPPALKSLDVTVLTRLILMEILGFDQGRLDDERFITYSSDAVGAVEAAVSGGCKIAFLLNPTKIDQVRAIAEAGLIMPRKTTYFYPKPITGQVINPLG
ncbi:MAG: DUF1015 domain-containing protein [Thermodesulfobacteriota bacterium]